MNSSPLQLNNYFVTAISFTANKEFDPQKEVKLQFSDIEVVPTFLKLNDNVREWQVALRIKQQPVRPEANAPYFFTIDLVGFFSVDEAYPVEKAELLITTNASSILFSSGREIVRTLTGMGPYTQMLLPAGLFYDAKAVKKTDDVLNAATTPK